MKALILAAGYATRMYPLTKEYPKPLLPVENKPIIDYIIEKIAAIRAVDEIIVITNSKFFPRFKRWAAKRGAKKRISLVDDLTKGLSGRRGAIGDMNFAINKKGIKDDLLVIGGDNLFGGSLKGFLSFTREKKNSPVIGAYDIINKKEAVKYGVLKLDKDKKVIDFKEKPKNPQGALVAMCLYYFPKDKLCLLQEYLKVNKGGNDATGFYIDWLRKKTTVYGFVFDGKWFDIGDLRFYNEAREKFIPSVKDKDKRISYSG